MDLFLINAISLDTELVSNYPQIVNLADHLFDEVSGQIRITNKYRSKEALKLILINLYKGYRRGRAVRYSRDKGNYSDANGRYYQIWFKYDRIMDHPDHRRLEDPGIRRLQRWSPLPRRGCPLPIADLGDPKLLDLFHNFEIKQIARLEKRPPQEIVQLRARKKDGGRRLPYEETPERRPCAN